MRVKIYVEGGGDTGRLAQACRRGFSEFFAKAGFGGKMPAFVACGPRAEAYGRFCTAHEKSSADTIPMLLVDSESDVAHGANPWTHLNGRDGWKKPDKATDEQAQLMVQCMESWFLADRDKVATYYGKGFNEGALPANPRIEAVLKGDVQEGLKNATRPCGPKKEYDKGRDSYAILGSLDPARVCQASPHANMLIEAVRKAASAT